MKILLSFLFLVLGVVKAEARPVTCTTGSRGVFFTATDFNSRRAAWIVVDQCRRHWRTNSFECERNLDCDDSWGGGGGPHWPDCNGSDWNRPECNGGGNGGDHGGGWPGGPGHGGGDHGGGWPGGPGHGGDGHDDGWQRREDARCYLNRYPDICQNSPRNYCLDPEKHYREHGRGEGRTWGCTGRP